MKKIYDSQNSLPLQERWLTEKEVANITGLSCSTLQKQRHRGIGISYTKAGRAVRYSILAVLEYMKSREINISPQM